LLPQAIDSFRRAITRTSPRFADKSIFNAWEGACWFTAAIVMFDGGIPG
jgi:hypothetical protein